MSPNFAFGGVSAQQIMSNKHPVLLWLLISGVGFPLGLLAQEEQVRQRSPSVDFLYAFLPLIIIGGLLWLFLRKSQRSPFMRRSIEHYERSEQHMQRMEQIGERIATAIEKRNQDDASDHP